MSHAQFATMVASLALHVAVFAQQPQSTPRTFGPLVTEQPTITATSVMQRAIDAVGPVSEVKFVRVQGTIDGPEGHSTIDMLSATNRPARLLIRQRLPDQKVMEIGCNGEIAWMRNPRDGSVQPLETAAVIATSAGMLPTRMMFAIADRFPHRSLGAREKYDDVLCQRLDLEDRDGMKGCAWFRVDTGQLLAIRNIDRDPTAPATEMKIESWLTVGPLTVPGKISVQRGAEITRSAFTVVAFDAIPEADFAPPQQRTTAAHTGG